MSVPSLMRIDQFVIRTILFSSGQYPHTPRQKKRTCPEETNMSGRNEHVRKKRTKTEEMTIGRCFDFYRDKEFLPRKAAWRYYLSGLRAMNNFSI